jgi:hypothetical protein
MSGKARPGRKRGLTWKALLAWAAELPGVEQGICYGTPALYVRKRILARLREDGETVAIKIDLPDRDVLLEADPVAFFLTDHYRPYPMVVMRLAAVRPIMAQRLLEQAWQREAPKRLAATRATGTSPRSTRQTQGRRK